jgi:hypothetical protein
VVYRSRICNLQKKTFGGLLDLRALESKGSIDSPSWFDSSATDPVGLNGHLLNGIPTRVSKLRRLRLTSQLHLRRYQFDSFGT